MTKPLLFLAACALSGLLAAQQPAKTPPPLAAVATPSASDCGPKGVKLRRGERGGCYYLRNNKRVYVDRKCCR